jgi:hypothetical protein
VTPDELHDRYVAEIDKRGGTDKYIDGVEERELMQIAIQHGFPPERARAVVVEVCREKGYVIEASLVQEIRDRLKSRSRTDGTIDRTGFDDVVRETAVQLARTTRSPQDVLLLVVNTMDDAGYRRARSWWQPDWYGRVKKRIGMN